MPANSGMAFVLVPHLDPRHDSLMVEVLSRQTAMPVREAAHRMAIEPNHVYVVPPNRYLAVRKRHVILSRPPVGPGVPTAIDFALRSLAEDQKEHAIGIVLSGTGTHGTAGLKEIKLAGGMIMVQDPATAAYDQMPRSVLASGMVVDYVLAPEKMPAALLAYSRHVSQQREHEPASADAIMLDGLKTILALLLARTKSDFRSYRKNMILRRIQRRMALLQIEDIHAFIERLREDPAELTALRKDLSIGVTAFFREPDAFDVLSARVFPTLIERSTPGIPVRVWVPACATGEEAYTIAILLFEQFRAAGKEPHIQIFATDIDEDSLQIARQGVYPDSIVGALSPERLKSFFSRKDEHHFQVAKHLREPIAFASQNLIKDPAFSRIDLISCRNVLIYLEPDVQARIIARLHFALNAGGCLLLGPAESIGRETGLFEPVSKKWRVFRRIGPERREVVSGPVGAAAVPEPRPLHPVRSSRPAIAPTELMRKVLLKEFVPAAALVNGRFEILSVHGPVVNYLEFPPGQLTRGLMGLCREGLRAKLRAACHKAVREGQTVHDPDARVHRDGDYIRCTVTVRPITESRQPDGLLLVVFQDLLETPRPEGARRKRVIRASATLHRLEDELRATREDLQTTIEELEGSNEELRASNEEVTSMNEDLQSVNEELETSREELQSLNEELATVNKQLEEKVQDLDAANSDMDNLMAAADLAIVFLDRELRIKRFTAPTARLLNLLESDVGHPFGDIAPRFTDGELLRDAQRVVETLTPVEKEVRMEENRWYLRRILPYRSGEDRIGGVVVTFIDITRRVATEAEVRRLATVLQDSEDAITVRDFGGQITVWNRGAEKMYGYSRAEALKLNIRDFVTEESVERTLDVMRRVARGETVPSFETQRRTRNGPVIDVWATITLLRDAAGNPDSLATTERDITMRRKVEADIRSLNAQLEQRVAERTTELRQSEEQLRAILDATADAVVTIDTRGRIVMFNKSAERIFGHAASETIGQNVRILMPPLERERHDTYLAQYRQTGVAHMIGRTREVTACRKDGTVFPIQLSVNEVDHRGLYVGFVRDMTAYRALQKEILNIAVLEQRRIGQELHDGTQQELTGLGLLAQNLSDELGHAGTSAASQLAARLAEGIAHANRHVRSLARGMVPIPVGKEGLMLALAELARSTEENSGLSCRFECATPVAVDNDTTATHLYRIAQEAISNAVRHAKAKMLCIRLERADGQLVLEVQDDGIGIEPQSVPSPGVGLRLMAHRCELIGGTLAVKPREEGGTQVICSVPQVRHA
jgi:two-component system CheB/CheR fusion protein